MYDVQDIMYCVRSEFFGTDIEDMPLVRHCKSGDCKANPDLQRMGS